MSKTIMHPVSDQVKSSFVFFTGMGR